SFRSALSSPTLRSSKLTAVLQLLQGEEVKAVLPLESAAHHCPVCCTRPAISVLPSPLKSPTWTVPQVTLGAQLPHIVVLNVEPVDKPTHQFPELCTRPARSALPSPLKSPT